MGSTHPLIATVPHLEASYIDCGWGGEGNARKRRPRPTLDGGGIGWAEIDARPEVGSRMEEGRRASINQINVAAEFLL